MRKSTRFLLVVPLLSVFATLSLSAVAEDTKKSVPKPPVTQQKKGHGDKAGLNAGGNQAAGTSGAGAPQQQNGGEPGPSAADVVGGAVGGAVGGLLGAFGPK